MTVLLREAIGDRLRHARTNQRRSLREISHAARVSLGYLSEVERGQKEASSELLAAICDALDMPLATLLRSVASDVDALGAMAIDGADFDGHQRPPQEGAVEAEGGGLPTAMASTATRSRTGGGFERPGEGRSVPAVLA
ncbi:helix-turn-helix transcriptional regulator [Haloechinothrix sp. LS1_15]|uniref:helix-turn-helix domain-containing protein n=1 Tax=Haloechinothrix sp. LS1_15 TaxID=2652248 RepID=UPI00294457AF|nr:helix-turn-helix transcriptional regulator [Haloechinothrix sp. LS1_15]MDV6012164.1 helix-turn-helix transcriptional regulator [Haloechinothrix sp. LS1_15]